MVKILSHSDGGPRAEALDSLRASIDARGALDLVIAKQVRSCRRAGIGWHEIADVTGVSKPTAIARWEAKNNMPTSPVNEWPLEPGETIRRRELHDLFGGNRQKGIAPAANSDDVFLFAEAGEEHGYVDEPQDDGSYEYTGEGKYGDQMMARGNRDIRDHVGNGKTLRLFQGARGVVTYLGKYEYDSHTTRKIRTTQGSGQREVFVFTLRPIRS